VLNITRRKGKPYTRYSPQLKNSGDIPVDGRITFKHIYGRRLYRREFNCLDLFLSGWNSGFRHKGFVSFCPTARRFSRNFSCNTICITFLSTFVLYIVLSHLLNYALFPAQSFVSFGVLSVYLNKDRAFPSYYTQWRDCYVYVMRRSRILD
jgi:hypothetical protein